MIHRDIKPENILLSDGQAVLADFGIARALDAAGGDQVTEAGLAMGTPAYMSPEQSAGSVGLDGRSDIYALGCVVYEMLGGQPPFPGPTPQAILARHAMDSVPSLRTLRPAVPVPLARVVTQALAKVPADRFLTARLFAMALAAPPTGESQAVPGDGRQRRKLVAAVAGLAIVVGGAAAVLARRSAGVNSGRPLAEEERSIAVLPLVNLTPGKENEFLSDAITGELIDQLSRVEGLRVAARASAFAFKGKSPDPREVGEKLHVATMLDGSVQVSGNRVRVTVELVNSRDGRRVWFDTYDRFLTDVLTVQVQIARAITGPLELRFVTSIGTPVVSGASTDQEAHKLYLKGRQYSYSFDGDERRLAVEYFRKAVERDSNYALAWAGLSDGYNLMLDALDSREMPEVREQARAAALRAVALDSTLAEAHAALGNIQYFIDWNWGAAEQSLRRAIAPTPTMRWPTGGTRPCSRSWDAIRKQWRRPSAPSGWTRSTRSWSSARSGLPPLRGIMEGSRGSSPVDGTRPTSEHGYTTLGRMQFFEGKQREAFANLERGAKLEKGMPYSVNALRLAWAYAASGQREKARQILGGVQREPGRAWPPEHHVRRSLRRPRRPRERIRLARTRVCWRESEIEMMGAMPELDPLRGDPRFTSLLMRMRIPT